MKRSPGRTATACLAFILLLLAYPLGHAQDSDADGTFEQGLDTALDDVETALREGDTDEEAGRGFLERFLDFLKDTVLAAYDAVASKISGSDEDTSVTLEEYNQLRSGMTYDQVVAIVAMYAETLSESTRGDGSGGNVIVSDKRWRNSDRSEMLATFENNFLVQLSQSNLIYGGK